MTERLEFGRKTVTAAAVAAGVLVGMLGLAPEAKAQYYGTGTSSLRSPLIPTASSSVPYVPPMQGQPPAVGDGSVPYGVTPGMAGAPIPVPATQVCTPQVPAGPDGRAMINGYVAPYLTPPTTNNPSDPGMIDSPPNFYSPPVAVTNINPGGGIPESAPTQRWGGQTTRDFGRRGAVLGQGSSLTDFGQKLTDKANLKVAPQTSQDGPRSSRQGQNGNTRASNLPAAQATTDLYGNRTLYKGPNQRARFTIANY